MIKGALIEGAVVLTPIGLLMILARVKPEWVFDEEEEEE